MKVYLVRHASAVPEGPHLPDARRYLDAEGRRVARAVGRWLRKEGVALDALLTSPLPRAVQTAELLAEALDFLGVIEVLGALAPEVPPRVVALELQARREADAVAVVGHEPGISALGALLVGQPSFPPMRPAQVALVDGTAPRWMLRPDTLTVDALRVAP